MFYRLAKNKKDLRGGGGGCVGVATTTSLYVRGLMAVRYVDKNMSSNFSWDELTLVS